MTTQTCTNRTFAAAVVVLALGAGSALAEDVNPPVSLAAARCTVLMEQFTRAAQPETVDDTARSIASQGIAHCRRGQFLEGANALAEAVRMIGRVPAEPSASAYPSAYQAHD